MTFMNKPPDNKLEQVLFYLKVFNLIFVF
jgi:hypothetical protein